MLFNYYYLLFMLPGFLLSLLAQFMVSRTFNRYNKERTLQGLTGAEAARRILDLGGLGQIRVNRVSGKLSDNYDPGANVVNLSEATYGSNTISAVGVAAHECGHALQHEADYLPSKLRLALVPVVNIGSSLSMPLIFIGLLLSIAQLAYVGIFLFSLAVLFQLVTLPVELNASRRAIRVLDDAAMLTVDELGGAKKVLTAAAFTYVAALLTSMLQLLYFVSLVGGGRSRR